MSQQNMAKNLVVIGYNKEAYKIIYRRIRTKLYERIESARKELSNSKNPNDIKFHNESTESIINDYLHFPERLMEENPIYDKRHQQTDKIASAYLLSRFIGSAMNANRKTAFFRQYFNTNWTVYRKHLFGEALSCDEKNILSQHIGEALFELDHIQILKQTGTRKKILENLKVLGQKTAGIKFDESDFSGQDKKIFTQLAEAILQACRYIVANGGPIKCLKRYDRTIFDPAKSDFDKVKQLSDEIQRIKGFGPALSRNFFKDMGYGIFSKPDVHVLDVINRLNLHLYYEWGDDQADRASRLLSEIAKSVSTSDNIVTANQVDKMIWLMKSGRYHIHRLSKAFKMEDEECRKFCEKTLNEIANKSICEVVSIVP